MKASRLPREPQVSKISSTVLSNHPTPKPKPKTKTKTKTKPTTKPTTKPATKPAAASSTPSTLGPSAQIPSPSSPSPPVEQPCPSRVSNRPPRNADAPLRPRPPRYRRGRRIRGIRLAMGSWWVPSRIESSVTRKFVLSQLLPDEIERLDQPVAFGDEELTERTYWESIRDDAPRLFLILVDLGVPDQIFGVIDDGWDDAELPVALEDVDRLQLTAARDERVERKFYQRQFHYLLRTLEQGNHEVYNDYEVVPVDVVDRPPLTPHKTHMVDKVKLPNASGTVFCRRRYLLGNAPGCIPPHEFIDAIQNIRGLQNDHIVSYWASYTHHGSGYVLFTPATDYSLKSFLATMPSSYKSLAKQARRELIMNWILCLVDTMCFLHSKNRSHCCIKPSTILFNHRNHICLADSTRLTPDSLSHQSDKSTFDREWYDYAAPEQWFRPTGASSPPARMASMPSASTSPDNGFNIAQVQDLSSSPNAMLLTPNPQLSPQQADIFSLGCVILELLSFLVKRSTSKFAAFRSAKHKTAGRGGAVLDTSFHRNLGQVESWMSSVAKDASKKVSSSEGGNAFRGVVPMLHVVTAMLSANPLDRPPAIEVQQRVYQIVTEVCGIQEPHCVHQYSHELDYALGRICINKSDVPPSRRQHRTSIGYGTPRAFNHSRGSSSGGYSQTSRTTASSEGEVGYSAAGPSTVQRGKAPAQWTRDASYLPSPGFNQASLYAAGS